MKHGVLQDRQDRLAREVLADSPRDWERLDVGESIYIVARGDTAVEFRTLVDNFEAQMKGDPSPVVEGLS